MGGYVGYEETRRILKSWSEWMNGVAIYSGGKMGLRGAAYLVGGIRSG